MENNPFGSKNFESSNEDVEKPAKEKSKANKKAAAEQPNADQARHQKVHKDLAESLEKMVVFERPKADTAEVTNAPVETLSSDEVHHAQQEIARDHLAGMEQVDESTATELQPAAAFLERVAEGEDPEAAFLEVAAENGLTEQDLHEAPEAPISDAEQTDVDDVPQPFPTSAPVPVGPRGTTARPTPTGSLPAAANTYYAPYRQRERDSDFVVGAVVGGVVGYLLGRRRGRIKTEKRLLPVQKKLERQVSQLEQAITHKEQVLVAARAKQQSTGEAKPIATRKERVQPGRQETRLGMQKPNRVEQLSHMIVAVEAPVRVVERVEQVERQASIRKAFQPEAVRDMQRNELLELSEKITVEGASLRRIYESRLIGEKQLRHLVTEYLKGKDIHADLRQEMVEHEIDFERDPILRDRVRSHLATSSASGGLGSLLASVGIVDEQTDPALEKRIQAETQRRLAAERKVQRQRTVTDAAMATAIVVLAVVVAILVVRS